MSRRKDNVDLFCRCLSLQRIKRTAIGVLNSHTPEEPPAKSAILKKKYKAKQKNKMDVIASERLRANF